MYTTLPCGRWASSRPQVRESVTRATVRPTIELLVAGVEVTSYMWPYSRIRPSRSSERGFPSRRLLRTSTNPMTRQLNRLIAGHKAQSNDSVDVSNLTPIRYELLPLPDDGRLSVVGESHYQENLKTALAGRVPGNDLFSHIPAIAAMVPEPQNPYDNFAVRIDVVVDNQLLTVGHLGRSRAGISARTS